MVGLDDKSMNPALSDADRARGQRALIRTAVMERIRGSIVSGTVATLFLLGFGALPIHVGIINGTRIIAPLASVLGMVLISRFGKIRMMIYSRQLALVPLVMLLVLARWGQAERATVWMVILALAVLDFLIVVGQTSWWPLLQDNTQGDKVGAFFARLRIRLRITDVALPLAIGVYLGRQPDGVRFFPLFLVTAAALVVGAIFLRGVPELPSAVHQRGMIGRFGQTLRVAPIRNYLVHLFLQGFITSLFFPFWVVKLTSYNLSAGLIVWLTSAVALGQVVFTQKWGDLVDDHGSRSLLTLSLIPQALMGLAWLALPSGSVSLIAWAVVFHLVFGFLTGGMMMGQTVAMLHAVSRKHQVEAFTLVQFIGALGGAGGALVGGVVFQGLAPVRWEAFNLDGQQLYLMLTQLAMLGAWATTLGFKDRDRQTSTRRLVRVFWLRMHRLFANQ